MGQLKRAHHVLLHEVVAFHEVGHAVGGRRVPLRRQLGVDRVRRYPGVQHLRSKGPCMEGGNKDPQQQASQAGRSDRDRWHHSRVPVAHVASVR